MPRRRRNEYLYPYLRRGATLIGALTLIPGLALARPVAHDWHAVDRPARTVLPLPKNLNAPRAKSSAQDPIGDTFGAGMTQIDVVELRADVVGNTLVIGIDFSAAISLPDSELPNAIDGIIDIDVDQDGATGLVPFVDLLTGNPTTGMGDEFHLDLFDFDSTGSTISLVDDVSSPGTAVDVPIAFGNDSLTVTIPLALLGDDGAVDVAAIVGTLAEPTDVAPNSGSVASGGGGTGNEETILLQGGRFEVGVIWSFAPDFQPQPAQVSSFQTDLAAIFTFANPENLEFLVKVLDGCDVNDHFWVFFAGATNVEFTLTVIDTQSSQQKTYFNPQGQPANAVTDTAAFATCP